MPMNPSEDLNGYSDGGRTYLNMMNQITKNISQYPGHKSIASSLGKFIPQEIVAGLIGCIIPESGSNHTILNAKEYRGGGAKGTEGWNCGEGLIQWTYWKYKSPLITKYNADSRSTQKLPTTWDQYKQGTPISKGNLLYAAQDGRHIAGLTLDNQMLFLTIYYGDVINKLKGETNLAVIVARIYQKKAGVGFYQNEQDPIRRAYITSRDKYPSSAGNHYLQSLKIAYEYMGSPIPADTVPPTEYTTTTTTGTQTEAAPTTPVTPKLVSGMNVNSKKTSKGIVLGYHMKQK